MHVYAVHPGAQLMLKLVHNTSHLHVHAHKPKYLLLTLLHLQLTGLGKLSPNTIVIGYKTNWTKCTAQEVDDYVALLQ